MMHLSNPQTYNPKYFPGLQILNLVNFKATLVRQAWHSCRPLLKVAFFRKYDVFLKSPKKIFQKNYLELEI
jgi:hypothetical protein